MLLTILWNSEYKKSWERGWILNQINKYMFKVSKVMLEYRLEERSFADFEQVFVFGKRNKKEYDSFLKIRFLITTYKEPSREQSYR